MAPNSPQSRPRSAAEKRSSAGGGLEAPLLGCGGSSSGVQQLAAAAARTAAVGPPVARGRGTSRFRGVSWSNDRNKWMASLYIRAKKRHFLGLHLSEEDAARAYDDEVRRLSLSPALLNFPREGEAPAGAAAPAARSPVRSSRFLGVSWHKDQRKWRARLYVSEEKRDHFLGFYAAEEAAARARDAEVIRLNLPKVPLNFPPPGAGEAPTTEFDDLVSFAAAAAAALKKQERRRKRQKKRAASPSPSAKSEEAPVLFK